MVIVCYYINMNAIKQTIDTAIFGYDPSEFMPIRVDGKVANWSQFAAYKAKRAVTKLLQH